MIRFLRLQIFSDKILILLKCNFTGMEMMIIMTVLFNMLKHAVLKSLKEK